MNVSKNKNRTIFFILLFFMTGLPWLEAAAAAATSYLERMVGLARLWGCVKYVHPYLPQRPIDWDGALIAALPKVRSATKTSEYCQALAEMLACLNDPATFIEAVTVPTTQPKPAPISTAARRQPYLETTRDGIAIIVCNDYNQFTAEKASYPWLQENLVPLFKEAAGYTKILVDARNIYGQENYNPFLMSSLGEAIAWILSQDVFLPTIRYKKISGLVWQQGSNPGFFAHELAIQTPGCIRAQRNAALAKPHIVIVTNSSGAWQAKQLLGLQNQGIAQVVFEGPCPSTFDAETTYMNLPEEMSATIRTTEMLGADGQSGFHPDLQVKKNGLEAGLALLRDKTSPNKQANASQAALPLGNTPIGMEKSYADMACPDREYRLLALFRFWIAIEYFYPHKEIMDQKWEDTLKEFIPRLEAATDPKDYQLTIAELTTRLQDSHVKLESKFYSDYFGDYYPPLLLSNIENQVVITDILESGLLKRGLAVGDVLLAIDGKDIAAERQRLTPLLSAARPDRVQDFVCKKLLGGQNGSRITITVRKPAGRELSYSLLRNCSTNRLRDRTYKLPVYGVLPSGFGYIDLERIKPSELAAARAAIQQTPALILDMRGYPKSSGGWQLAESMTEKKTAVAKFEWSEFVGCDSMFDTHGFTQYFDSGPTPFRYSGKIVMLVHSETQSAAEHLGLIMESLAPVTFIGSPTSGANGGVSYLVLPGGISVRLTAIGVRHADGRQLQRVGLQPHIVVRPTIKGIQAGRDEVLEKAIEFLQQKRQ